MDSWACSIYGKKTILTMERKKATATDIALAILKANLRERQDNVFIPHGAKKVIKAQEENVKKI